VKILILSDTHGHLDDRIIYYTQKVDEIWHAGDIGSIELIDLLKKNVKVNAVYGNIDGKKIRSSYNEYLSFFCEKISILLVHIAGKPIYYNKKTNELIKKYKPKILVCGHSHILKVVNDKKNNLLYINPGAAGKFGFHKKRTMIKIEVINNELKKLEVIELNKYKKKLP
tara:strand:+ start:406 stop:912 length:507 start_codon:yes stop_codon:yes gene_type:complete